MAPMRPKTEVTGAPGSVFGSHWLALMFQPRYCRSAGGVLATRRPWIPATLKCGKFPLRSVSAGVADVIHVGQLNVPEPLNVIGPLAERAAHTRALVKYKLLLSVTRAVV